MEAITSLKDPGGSNKTTIAAYIEVLSLFNKQYGVFSLLVSLTHHCHKLKTSPG